MAFIHFDFIWEQKYQALGQLKDRSREVKSLHIVQLCSLKSAIKNAPILKNLPLKYLSADLKLILVIFLILDAPVTFDFKF